MYNLGVGCFLLFFFGKRVVLREVVIMWVGNLRIVYGGKGGEESECFVWG